MWDDTGRSNQTAEKEDALEIDAEYPEILRPNTLEDFFNHPEIPQIASNCVRVATFMIRHAMNFQKMYNHAWF